MQAALRLKAQVLPGKRVEFSAPELPEGGEVELIVVLPETTPNRFSCAQDYLDSLPPLSRSPEEWAEIEREFIEERIAWEH